MKKGNAETTPATRRKNLAEDVEAFLKAGNEIEHVPNGVSAQDPQGRGKPLRLGQGNVQAKGQEDASAQKSTESKVDGADKTEQPKAEQTEAETKA